MAGAFKGFSPEALNYLTAVKLNNSKEWFETHRTDYNELILTPFKSLVSDLSDYILAIDYLFEVTPAVNKTISRIFRDTRFSKDKSLYRNTMWLTFKRAKKEWRDAPAFFFEISPSSYRYGMGYYSASRESMDTFRQTIDENPKDFTKATAFFTKQDVFQIEGDEYKKSLAPDKPAELRKWYDRKNLYLVHNSTQLERLFTKDIAGDLVAGFNMLSPIYQYLCMVEARKAQNSKL